MIVESAVKSWNELKSNPVYQMIEKYRLTALPLPNTIPNPFPASFGFEDYTNKAIDAIQKRGRYMTMEELSNISAPTQAMQDAIQSSLKPGRAGGIIGAPAGFGKSYTFQYLGIMAAERSLSHTFLWFKGGALTSPQQLKNAGAISDYHFMFTDAKNLSQTGGLHGGGAGPLRELSRAAREHADKFVLCLDELYTALSQDTDTAAGWFALKGLTEPEILVKIIGTMASKNVPMFKSLKVPQMTSGSQEAKTMPVYDEQMKTRFAQVDVPDYTDEEQKQTLDKGGLYAITHQAEFKLNYSDADKQTIISDLVEKTNQIEAGVAPNNREWAAPRKWKRIISEANSLVTNRQEEFSQYTADVSFLKKTADLEKWYAALRNIESEKKSLQSGGAAPANTPAANEEPVGVLSIRDKGINHFPHEEIESPQVLSEQKKVRFNDLEEKEAEIKAGLEKIKRQRRYVEMSFKQGLNRLKSMYGDGVFADDMHDLGNLKPVDIEMVNIAKIKIDQEDAQ